MKAFKSLAGRAVVRPVFHSGQAGPPLAQAFRMKAALLRITDRSGFIVIINGTASTGMSVATAVGILVLYVVESVGRPSSRDILG
jgi:hypothetical protein